MQTQLRSFVTGNVVNLAVTLAGLILLAVGLVLARDAWEARQSIERMKQANAITETLLEATDAQARERGLTAALLGGKPPGRIPDELVVLRQEVDGHWSAVMQQMERVHDAANIASPIKVRTAALGRALRDFSITREQVDKHLRANGKSVSMARWFETTTTLNAEATALRQELMLAIPLPGELMRLNLLVRDNGAKLAEYAGQVRGLLAYYAAARVAMPEEAHQRAELSFQMAKQYLAELLVAIDGMDNPPGSDRQFEKPDSDLYKAGQEMLDAANDGEYPYTAEQWYALTTKNINSIFELIETASNLTVSHLQNKAHQELMALLLYAVLAAVAVIFAGMSLQRVRANAEQVFVQKEMAETILDSVADAVIAVDADGFIRYINPIAEDLTGWKLDEARHKHYSKVFRLYNRLHTSQTDPIGACLKEGMVIILSEGHALLNRNAEEIAIDDSCAPIRDQNGDIAGAVVVFSSKERHRNSDRILTYHATRDVLTELYNRRVFENHLRELIEHAEDSGVQHTLAFIDVDNFKVINDSGGHAAGDQMLRQIVFVMKQHTRGTDMLARIGGDEFGLLFKKCTGEQALRIAEKLQEAVRELRFEWGDNIYQVGLSIGLVEINADSGGVDELIREADAACYSAKEKGRNHIQIYSPQDMELARRQGQMQWVTRITDALDNDRFELFCQEIRPLKNGLPMHGEILVRMQGNDNELIPPNAFIPAAERHGLMPDIDRWIVENLSRKISPVLQSRPDMHININLSGTTLSDPEAVARLADIIRNNGIRPGNICFEVTETAAIASLDTTVMVMQRLRRQGFRFALDDFGSGLSSLNYLKTLPVDMLKIDGTFIRRLDDDVVARAMIEAITKIADLMNIHTCAEFVENDTILARLNELGIDYGQGYYFHRPSPLDECLARSYDIPTNKILGNSG